MDDDDDEILWSCDGCHLLIVDALHCPCCGTCAPWGCGMDHEADDDGDGSWDDFDDGEDNTDGP